MKQKIQRNKKTYIYIHYTIYIQKGNKIITLIHAVQILFNNNNNNGMSYEMSKKLIL